MKVGVVFLHYRRWPGVRTAMDALLAQTLVPQAVIVVDNASGDGSVALLREAYPDLTVVDANENGGYARGMNLGVTALAEADCDAVLLMTHDCHLSPTALAALVARLSASPQVGVVGPLLGDLRAPDSVWSAGGKVDSRTWDLTHSRHPSRVADWAGSSPQEVDWLDGACLLIRTAAWIETGGLDERFFLYIEDAEFALRVRRIGWTVECVPAAIAWQSPSGNQNRYLLTRNRILLLRAHAPSYHLMRECIRILRHATTELFVRGRRRSAFHRLCGLVDASTGRLRPHRAQAVDL